MPGYSTEIFLCPAPALARPQLNSTAAEFCCVPPYYNPKWKGKRTLCLPLAATLKVVFSAKLSWHSRAIYQGPCHGKLQTAPFALPTLPTMKRVVAEGRQQNLYLYVLLILALPRLTFSLKPRLHFCPALCQLHRVGTGSCLLLFFSVRLFASLVNRSARTICRIDNHYAHCDVM